MADLQPGGAKVPEEKKGKNGKEKAEKSGELSDSQKRAMRRRRNIQRRRLAGELEKAGVNPQSSEKKTQPLAVPEGGLKLADKGQVKPAGKPRVQKISETHPVKETGTQSTKLPVPPIEKKPAAEPPLEETKQGETEEKEEFLTDRPTRVREELHPRTQKMRQTDEELPAGQKMTEAKKTVTGEIKGEEKKETVPEDRKPAEEAVVAQVSPENEGEMTEEKPGEEENRGMIEPVTYFAHPFGTEDESVAEDSSGEETDAGAVPSVEPGSEKAVVEEIPLKEEEDLVIGEKAEKPLPIIVGKLREEEKTPQEKETSVEKGDKIREGEVTGEEKDVVVAAESGKKELLGEKQPLVKKLQEWVSGVSVWIGENVPGALKGLGAGAAKIGTVIKPKLIIFVLFVLMLAGGGYWAFIQGWPGKIQAYVSGFFVPKTAEKEVQPEVIVNPEDLREFGIISANIFAGNSGSVNDLIPVQIRMSYYFGMRQEPSVKGETGISAATFYGELKDSASDINQFVIYMKKLEEVQNLYKTDVYAMLDRSAERDKVLLDYLDKLKKAGVESREYLSVIRVNMDDLKVSYESINPDKTKYEKDFFTAMDNLEAEKSDVLLKGFVDISQKQTALKARINALSKLITYYETVIKRLDTRILAIEQNTAALIQGIRVVDIPGANLDIIIRPETSK